MRPQGPWEKRRKLQLEGWHEAIEAAIKIRETAARGLPRGHRGRNKNSGNCSQRVATRSQGPQKKLGKLQSEGWLA